MVELNSVKATDIYNAGWDEGREALWNEAVCSVCGDSHDRGESAMCEDGQVVAFREWVEAHRD